MSQLLRDTQIHSGAHNNPGCCSRPRPSGCTVISSHLQNLHKGEATGVSYHLPSCERCRNQVKRQLARARAPGQKVMAWADTGSRGHSRVGQLLEPKAETHGRRQRTAAPLHRCPDHGGLEDLTLRSCHGLCQCPPSLKQLWIDQIQHL